MLSAIFTLPVTMSVTQPVMIVASMRQLTALAAVLLCVSMTEVYQNQSGASRQGPRRLVTLLP